MINSQHFAAALDRLSAELPMQKNYDPSIIADLWENFPTSAKIHLTPEALHFAVGQRILDPNPPREIAPHNRLLHYVFPVVDGVPLFSNGLRPDINERLRDPDRFHDPSRRPEQVQPRALPQSRDQWHPAQLSPEERVNLLQRARAEIERLAAEGLDGEVLTPAQLRAGKRLFHAGVIPCFIPFDARSIAATWARRNSKEAFECLDQAINNDKPENTTSPIVAVAKIVGFYPPQETSEDVFA